MRAAVVCVGRVLCGVWLCFFLFKQKTAYEMRISDWSSDVCSSDLIVCNRPAQGVFEIAGPDRYDLADLALKILAANEEKREVVVHPDVRYLGAHFAGEVLNGARQRFASTRFDAWLHDWFAFQ